MLFAVCLTSYSLLFPNRLSIIDQVRLSLQSAIITKACDSLIGKEYVDENNIPVEGPTDISYAEFAQYRNSLKPGDVFFTSSRRYVGSMFVHGKWKHSVIYLGTREKLISTFGESSNLYRAIKKFFVQGDEELIIDSSLHGVHVRDFRELSNLGKVSYLQAITAFRPKIPSGSKVSLLKSALEQISKKYDFDLLTYDTNSVYCSELLFSAFRAIGIDLDVPSKIVNRKILVPTDIVKYFIEKGVPEHQFSFLFFVEKKEYSLIERSAEDLS